MSDRDERGHVLLKRTGWDPPEGGPSLRHLPGLLASAFRLVWQAAPRLVMLLLTLQVVSAIAIGVSVFAVRSLVATLLLAYHSHAGLGTIAGPLGGLAAAAAALGFASALQGGITRLLQERATWMASERVLDVAGTVELEAFDHSEFHDRLERAQVAGMRPFQITQSLMTIAGSLTILAGVLIVLSLLEPVLVPAILLTVVPLLIAASAFSRDFYRFSLRFIHDDRRRWYLRSLLTTRQMAKEVRAFALAGFLRRFNQSLFDERMEDLTRLVQKGAVRSLAGSVAALAAVAATAAALLWLVLSGLMSLPSAAAAAVAITQLWPLLNGLAFAAGQLYEGSLFLEDHRAFCEMLPRIRRNQQAGPLPNGFETICVEGVTFAYPEAGQPALEDVSMTLRCGEVVALVGENGSGKTTLAKLLCQLYQPQAGRIRWDSTDLAEVDSDRVRNSVAVLFQDFAQYMFDVAANIGIGRVECEKDREGIERAAKRAGAHQLIATLPHGYETMLGKVFEGGVELSVGQWQRIALARAFFRDASLVILDEPTAALDARLEHELFEGMRGLVQGRTVLLISHRFSSVRSADRIYVLKDGRVVSQGTHAELMSQGGLYAELFTLQASQYLEAV